MLEDIKGILEDIKAILKIFTVMIFMAVMSLSPFGILYLFIEYSSWFILLLLPYLFIISTIVHFVHKYENS